MAEAKLITFSYKELAEALIKAHNIREGLWGIYMKFGIAAANVEGPDGNLVPAGIMPVHEIGLQQFDKENNLTVDAAAVNGQKGGKKPKT